MTSLRLPPLPGLPSLWAKMFGAILLFCTPANAQTSAPFELWDVPELIVNSYRAEDLPAGALARHPAWGFAPLDAAQPDPSLQPVMEDGAVTFTAGSGQNLAFGRVGDALRSYRWSLMVFRLDGGSTRADKVRLVSVNASTVAGGQTPRLDYDRARNRIVASWRGLGSDGTAHVAVSAGPVVADGETWNVVLTYRRAGRLYISVNGQTRMSRPDIVTLSAPPPQNDVQSVIGAEVGRGSPTWGYDILVFGQSELPEAMVQVVEGWAMWRADRNADLPEDHPYRTAPPVMADVDMGPRYHHDADAWAALWERNPRSVREVHRGKRLPGIEGYETVFFDDFRENRIGRSDQIGNGQDVIWNAPGWNGGVGRAARMATPNRMPELYAHDPDAETLTLSIGNANGRWFASAIYSVNDDGQGYSWANGGIYRVRIRFPKIEGNPDVAYFPAIPWFYNLEHLFWRTGERIELDAFEFEGIDPRWVNGGSSHVHKGHYPGLFGHLAADAPFGKILSDKIDLHIWDGEFHIWEMRITRETTILGLDGVELARAETPPEHLERLYMIADYALKPGNEPDPGHLHGMEIDWIEVLQPTEQLQLLPSVFRTHPQLTLSERRDTAHCAPNLRADVTDIRYYWFMADGYPLGFGIEPSRALAPHERAEGLRCMVRLSGLAGQPEAWSRPSN